jgi:hypothetical protein
VPLTTARQSLSNRSEAKPNAPRAEPSPAHAQLCHQSHQNPSSHHQHSSSKHSRSGKSPSNQQHHCESSVDQKAKRQAASNRLAQSVGACAPTCFLSALSLCFPQPSGLSHFHFPIDWALGERQNGGSLGFFCFYFSHTISLCFSRFRAVVELPPCSLRLACGRFVIPSTDSSPVSLTTRKPLSQTPSTSKLSPHEQLTGRVQRKQHRAVDHELGNTRVFIYAAAAPCIFGLLCTCVVASAKASCARRSASVSNGIERPFLTRNKPASCSNGTRPTNKTAGDQISVKPAIRHRNPHQNTTLHRSAHDINCLIKPVASTNLAAIERQSGKSSRKLSYHQQAGARPRCHMNGRLALQQIGPGF